MLHALSTRFYPEGLCPSTSVINPSYRNERELWLASVFVISTPPILWGHGFVGPCDGSPGDELLDAVEAALGVVPPHVGQVESKRPQLTWIFRSRY